MTVAVVLLAVAVTVLALLVAGLLRSHATILRRLHELGAGVAPEDDRPPSATDPATSAPPTPRPRPADTGRGRAAVDVQGETPDGEVRALRVVGAAHDTVLAFLSTGCATCEAFWQDLADPGLPGRTRLVVVTKGPEEELAREVAALVPDGVTVVMSSDAWHDYGVPGSPYVVHVDGAQGAVRGEGTGVDWPQVRRLLQLAEDQRGPAGKAAADARREHDIDRALLAAGVAPGDPSLYRHADHRAPEPHGPPHEAAAGPGAGDRVGGRVGGRPTEPGTGRKRPETRE